ncbi:hypothetical protein [Legionella sp.]|uniref:hypothetical protein n=1 Tax=Legionella sp. TaxID=459 RepID=UPI003C83BC5B
MNPLIIALICSAVFGSLMVISTFVRQLLLSRDKKLNDEAQSRAMSQEAAELEKIRIQMQSTKRFEIHYQMLGVNKDAIKNADTQIEELLHKKMELVERYGRITIQESGAIISSGGVSEERKAICDKLRAEIDVKMEFYDSEIKIFQKRRSTLWNSQSDFERYFLAQEMARNASLDWIYKQHSALLEKIYLRHIADTESVAVETIKAGTLSFKDIVMTPFQFLIQFFAGISSPIPLPNISFVQTRIEREARVDIDHVEQDINQAAVDEPAFCSKPNPINKEQDEDGAYNNQSSISCVS